MTEAEFFAAIERQHALDNSLYAFLMNRVMTEGMVLVGGRARMVLLIRADDAKLAYDFVLASTTAEADWACAICQDGGGDTVYHPNNCHVFHRECLNQALHADIRCSLCRAVAPQPHNMKKKD